MKQHYDLIGDIHGHHDKLTALLQRLGYQPTGTTWKHSEGRKVIFLGDYIDRGPKIRQVLQTVRGMCDAGDALAIMGNHEYNAVAYAAPDGKGGWLREHNERNTRSHRATLAQFANLDDEWKDWLEWMKRLPFALDVGGLRCVHACWDAKGLALLEGASLTDEAFLRRSITKDALEYHAVESVLKGPEIPASDGNMFRDKEGCYRSCVRVRWWGSQEGQTIGDLAMPPGAFEDDCPVEIQELAHVPNYSADAPPVFFGHYWLPPEAPKVPLASNMACLDYGAGLDGPLVAYRWDGEQELSPARFVAVDPIKQAPGSALS